MANPVCLSPLKFYDSLEKQEYRKSYAFGHISPVITRENNIPSFQFVIPNQISRLVGAFLIPINDSNIQIINEISETFSSCTSGNHNSTSGQTKQWTGNSNILITNAAYEAGGAIKLGTSSSNGSITTRTIFVDEGDIIAIKINVKGWTTVEGNLNIQIRSAMAGPIQSVAYSATINDNFETIFRTFVATSRFYTVTIASSSKRCFIDNLEIAIIKRGENSYNLIPEISSHFNIKSINNFKVAICNKFLYNSVNLGYYYLALVFDDFSTYYSEILCFTNSLDDYLKIEYRNTTGNFELNNGIISFEDNFKFEIYLRTELGKPNYEYEEEVSKRLGYTFIENQISKKVYRFNVIIPEYICDAMRIIRLCSEKMLISKSEVYDMITFNMDVDWQQQGDLASVTCEFDIDNIIVNLGGLIQKQLGGTFSKAEFNKDFK